MEDAGHFSYKNVPRPLEATVSTSARTRKDNNMKLLLILAVTLAISLAEDIEMDYGSIDDLQAAASMELQKSQQYAAPSRYTPTRPWNPPSNNYNTGISSAPNPPPPPPASQGGYFPVQNDPPQNTYYPQNNWDNQNSWNNNQNQNSWNQKPQNPGNNQQNNWNYQNPGSQNTWTKPTDTGSQNTWTKPTNTGSQNWNNQNTNNWNNNWTQPPSSTSSTTTPVSVIKNEHTLGENGSYKYEYEIADGQHVAEEGYFVNPNTDAESFVKKGFYSFTAADGKVYTVTYYADETGFHATGDHLPTPPPIPPAIQASIDQNAKEEAAKAEAEKNKQQQGYYPQGQEPPRPIVPPQTYPQQISPPQVYPTRPQQPSQPPQTPQQYPQQTYYPQEQPQQTYYPPTNYYPPQTGYGRRR